MEETKMVQKQNLEDCLGVSSNDKLKLKERTELKENSGLKEECVCLGTVSFTKSNHSGSDVVNFYRDNKGALYSEVHSYDPFDDSDRYSGVQRCSLPLEEIEKLIGEKRVVDYEHLEKLK